MNEHITTEELIDYLHHALAPEDDARVYAHIAACAPCSAVYEQETALSEALREHAQLQERDLPAGVSAAIWDAIALPQPTFADRIRTWLQPMVLIPIAAVVLLALLLLPQLAHIIVPTQTASIQSNHAPAIDAAYYLQDHVSTNRTVPFADTTAMVSSSLTTPIAVTADETQ